MKKQEEEQSENSLETLKCPRCDSTNTKFCYYNNYNKSQPRHFCRACKRHWTKGGTLRNVPFGGFRNNNKRLKKPTTTTTSSTNNMNNNIQISLDQNNMSSSLYQALIAPPPLLLHQQNLMMNMGDLESEDFGMTLSSSSLPLAENQTLLFPLRSSSNVYNYVDESTIDSVIASTDGINTHAWEIPDTSGDWSWEDIDSFL